MDIRSMPEALKGDTEAAIAALAGRGGTVTVEINVPPSLKPLGWKLTTVKTGRDGRSNP